jgi:imidazolonepropionase-like amidohydrolase
MISAPFEAGKYADLIGVEEDPFADINRIAAREVRDERRHGDERCPSSLAAT